VTKRKTGHDYEISDEFWTKIKPLLPPPKPKKNSDDAIQNMCKDKGYDFPDIRELVDVYGYTAHIRRRGEENIRKKEIPDYRARRWVVERTHSWLNRFKI
jgi:transposase